MIIIDPQQELFITLKLGIEAKGYAVYDGFLPPEGTPYPFVYISDSRQSDRELKNATHGFVYQTIKVWHNNPKQRGTLSKMLLDIKTVCRNILHTQNFGWNVRNINQRILPDTTTKQPLLQGILEVDFYFS